MPLFFSFLYLTQIHLVEKRPKTPSYSLCLSTKPWPASDFLPVFSCLGMFWRTCGCPDPLGVFSQGIGHIHKFPGKQESDVPADAIYNFGPDDNSDSIGILSIDTATCRNEQNTKRNKAGSVLLYSYKKDMGMHLKKGDGSVSIWELLIFSLLGILFCTRAKEK